MALVSVKVLFCVHALSRARGEETEKSKDKANVRERKTDKGIEHPVGCGQCFAVLHPSSWVLLALNMMFISQG